MSDRRFPPPWTVEGHNGACFLVKDKNGYALAYVYYEAREHGQFWRSSNWEFSVVGWVCVRVTQGPLARAEAAVFARV